MSNNADEFNTLIIYIALLDFTTSNSRKYIFGLVTLVKYIKELLGIPSFTRFCNEFPEIPTNSQFI